MKMCRVPRTPYWFCRALLYPVVPDAAGPGPSSSRRVVMARGEVPLNLLVTHQPPGKLQGGKIVSKDETRRLRRDVSWAQRREGLLAVAAVGVHVAIFAYNLAFWGFEGMPQDRWVCGAAIACFYSTTICIVLL